MTYNLSYDYASLVAITILLLYNVFSPKFRNFQNRLFGWIIFVGFISTLADILSAALFMPKFPDCIWVNRLAIMIYQTSQHVMPLLYYVYMLTIIYKEEAITMIKRGRWVILVPGALLFVVNILTPFTGWAFIYDETGYHRTDLYIIAVVIMIFYVLTCLIIAFVHKSRTGFLSRVAVVTYTLTMIILSIHQYLRPQTLVICSSAVISIFIMYLSLQSPALLKEALEDAEKARMAAEEASTAKANFLANMSHEIRTPMNAICGMAYLLESTHLNNDAKEYVDTIKSSSENLLMLINEILDFSKVDSGKMTLIETEYAIDNIVRDVSRMMFARLDSDYIVPGLYIAPEVPHVLRGDDNKVRQIIINLVNNAMKFTEEGQISLSIGCTKISAERVMLSIKVKDTGIGIKEEDQDKLFEQFEQVDMAKNRKKEGTGLGLSLVKSFCEIMNGHIEVESTYGSGSTFTAYIEQECVEGFGEEYELDMESVEFVVLEEQPYVRSNIEKTLKSVNAHYSVCDTYDERDIKATFTPKICIIYDYEKYHDSIDKLCVEGRDIVKLAMVDYKFLIPDESDGIIYARNPFSILTLLDNVAVHKKDVDKIDKEALYFSDEVKVAVVDDNRVNLKVTTAILKNFGIKAKAYISGYEILDEIEKGVEFDLIFMDHMMPEMDGIETVRKIRALHTGNCGRVPIVALTANAIKGTEHEFLDAGMNGTLFKPVNIDELEEHLVKWIPRHLRVEAPKE